MQHSVPSPGRRGQGAERPRRAPGDALRAEEAWRGPSAAAISPVCWEEETFRACPWCSAWIRAGVRWAHQTRAGWTWPLARLALTRLLGISNTAQRAPAAAWPGLHSLSLTPHASHVAPPRFSGTRPASLGLAGPTPWRPRCHLSPRPRPVLLFLSLLPRDSLPTPPSSLPAIPATVHSACCFLDGSCYYLARCVFIIIVHYVLSLLLLSSVSHVYCYHPVLSDPIITQLDQVFIVNIPHVVSFFLSTYVSGLSHLGHVSVVNAQSEQVPVSLLLSFVLTGN